MTLNTNSKLLLTGLFICIFGISAAGAAGIDYVGLDKVDLSWYEVSDDDFIKYQVYRDGAIIKTIFIASETTYRDEGVSEGTHEYKVMLVTTEDSGVIWTQTAEVGEPQGQLKCGDDTWADASVQLAGDVNLGGQTLTITKCDVLALSEYDITGAGYLAIQDSTFDTVTVDATAPYATLSHVSSNRPIKVRGGGIEASGVDIPWGTTWGPGDHVLSLSGDRNTITGCNAEIHTEGNVSTIKDCLGTHLKIYATGDNTTIQNNSLYDVRGIAIYAEGNDLRIHSNEVDNATRWEKDYYNTEGGIGIQICDSSRNVDIYDNTITGAEDIGIRADAYVATMANYIISFNTVSECRMGMYATTESTGWIVEENTLSNCSERAMYIQQADLMQIRENSFTDLSGSAYVEWSSNSSITHNTFTVRDKQAIEVCNGEDDGNITVAYNTITGIGSDSDEPDGITISAKDSIVEDNVITNCYRGIDAMNRENITVRDNQITDCRGEWGLYCYELNHGLVENNTLINTSAGGSNDDGVIYVHHTGNATVRKNLVDGGKNGVYIEFADDGLVIEQNTIKNTTSSAIRVNMAENGDGYHNYRGPADVMMRNNTIVTGGYAGFTCNYVYNTSFVNNTVTNPSNGVRFEVADNTVIRANRFENVRDGFSVRSAPGSVIEGNTFNVTQNGGIIDTGTGSKNTTVADNRFAGYEWTGVQVNEPEGTTLRNNTFTGTLFSWDIFLSIPEDLRQDTLVIEKNTVGKEHPTTITITTPDHPVYIRGVEQPPEPPSPPEYQTTKSSVGNWVQIIGQMGVKKAEMNLTFHYTEDQIIGVSENTLSIWKHNGTGWDPGNEDWEAWNGTRWQDLTSHEIGVEVKELCIFAPLGGKPVHNIRIPEDYSTITEALDAADFQDGDTITVDEGYSGTKENVGIYHEVKLKSSSGSPAAVTLTASDPYHPTVKISADDVEIDGFVITGATGSQGVRMEGCDNAKVTNSRIEGNFFGAIIGTNSFDGTPSTYCKVIDSTVTGNEHGAVLINQSNNCNVFDCTLSGAVGIGILDGQDNFVSGNTITDCADYGITIDGGNKNEVSSNSVSGGGLGIYLYGGESQVVKENTIADTTGPAILLEETEQNTFTENSITGAPLGIGCEKADDNTFTQNAVMGGDAAGSHLVGIALDDSDGNTLSQCTVSDLHVIGYATTGIEMTGTSHTNTIDSCRFSEFESARVDGALLSASGNLLRNCTFTGFRGATAGAVGISTTQNTTANTIRHCSFDDIYAPENATAFCIRETTDLTIVDCTVGTIAPANTSAFVVFENSAYSNVIEGTTLGTLADIYELHAEGNLTVSNTNHIPADEPDVKNIGHYLNLTSDGTGEAWVAFAYSGGELDGKNPALLSVWQHEGAGWQQVPAPNGVNTTEQYVYAYNVTVFSVFAPMWSGSGLPKANFTAAPTDGTAPLEVTFTDMSRNAESWLWTFGDGATATTQNPVHPYTTIGSFNVTLTVTNAIGTDVMTKTSYITVRDAPPGPAEGEESYATNNTGTTVTDIGDRQQVSFNATAGNGTVIGDDIILENGQLNVTIRTDHLTSVGNVSTGNVTGVLLESAPLNATIGGGVGNVSVNFNASMNAYNPDLGITTGIYDRPSDEAATAFTLAAADEGLSITGTAYAVYFTKTNMTDGNGITNATLQMTVSPDWVAANGGTGAIRIFRQADGGETQILTTTYLGTNPDGMMVFAAFSPDGFSSFAVAATSLAPTPTPTPTQAPVPEGDSDSSTPFSAATAGTLRAGETASLSVSNSPVTRIAVDMKTDAAGLLVTVTDQQNRPDGVPVYGNYIWRYLSFTLYRAEPTAIADAMITFGVPEDVLGGKTAVLMRLNGNEWEALPTEPAGRDGTNQLFTAETPGFSWFAIAIVDAPASSADVPEGIPTEPAEQLPTATVAPTSAAPATPTTTPTSVPPTQTPLPIAGVLFGAAGAGILFRRMR